ncbi:uncharacterized protein LOC135104487 isoform X2 [Scylla paramamosain]
MQHFQAMRALKSCVPEKYHTLFRDADDHLTGLLMDSKEKKGVVTTEPEQVAMTLGQHTASTAHDTSVRPSITPAASAVPVLYSHEAEQKSSSSLNQNTSDYVHSHQNYNMEGACALDPSHYHNLQTIDEKPSNLNHCCSSKVPVSLLNPTHHHIPSNYASTNHQPPAQNTTALLHNAGGAVSKKTVGCVSTATKPEKIITPHSVVSGPKESSRLPSAADPNKAVYRLPSAANPNKAIYRLPTAANPNKPVCLPTAAIPNKEICRLPTAANPNKPVYLPTAASPNKEIYHLPTAANPNKAIYRLPTAANPNKPVCLPTATNPNKEIYHIPTAASPNKEICRLPTAANPNKPVHLPSATSHEKAPNFLLNGAVERKINNNEGHGTSQEVSCEDNNHEELKSKSIKIPYDPDQDYLNKLEEKRAREAAREAQYRTGGSGSSSASNNSPLTAPYTRAGASPTSPTSPTSPSQQHPQLQQQQQQPPSSRKISNVSDAESPYSSVPVIPYKELEEATALWSPHNLLGRGGFGAVYRGTWKNTEVAIKRIEPHSNAHAHLDNTRLHITQSLDELKLLQSYRHDNILQVYGYSTDHESYPCLVYQFMPHGSLEDRLQCRRIEAFGESSTQRGPDVLGWKQRFRVALGTAGALQFLHTVKEKPLIHGDVKSANILLDQNYEPKLGDFGLAREGKSRSTSLQVSRVHGTKPYLPVDYLRSKKLSVKVDTYSFGIVLYELCTGLRGYDDKRKEGQKFLWELVEESDQEAMRDKKPVGTQEPEVFPFLLQLGKKCAQQRASQRPDMTDVFKELESFRMVMEERARARRISMGESSSGCSTPHLLQVRYDTAGSLHSPSTNPSFHYYFHHPSSPSAVSTLPPPPSPGIPRSPVPPGSPHYYPHPPLVHPNYPGMVMNGQVAYHPRAFPPGSQPVWVQGPADMICGVAPGVQKYYVPHNLSPGTGVPLEQQDPPSYSETMSQPPPQGAAALPIIPQLSSLNMNSNSESEYSDMSNSKSSVEGHTTQSVMPAALPQYDQTPAPAAEGGADGLYLPLLTMLNNTSSNCS